MRRIIGIINTVVRRVIAIAATVITRKSIWF